MMFSSSWPTTGVAVDLCAGLGGLLGLCAAELLGGRGLDGLVGLADGRGAGDGVLAQVGAVVALGGRVDDGGVEPFFSVSLGSCVSSCAQSPKYCGTWLPLVGRGLFSSGKRTCASPSWRQRWCSGSRQRAGGACRTS